MTFSRSVRSSCCPSAHTTRTVNGYFCPAVKSAPDASCIQDFTVVTRTQTSTRGMGLKRRTYRTTVYKLDALMSNGKTEFMRGLDEMSKGKVEEVQRIGRELLGRLG